MKFIGYVALIGLGIAFVVYAPGWITIGLIIIGILIGIFNK